MSVCSRMVRRRPMPTPFTAVMIGLSHSVSAARKAGNPCSLPAAADISLKSCPAQNASPARVISSASTSESAPAAVIAAVIAWYIELWNAFFFSGRFIVSTATCPDRSRRTSASLIDTPEPEPDPDPDPDPEGDHEAHY